MYYFFTSHWNILDFDRSALEVFLGCRYRTDAVRLLAVFKDFHKVGKIGFLIHQSLAGSCVFYGTTIIGVSGYNSKYHPMSSERYEIRMFRKAKFHCTNEEKSSKVRRTWKNKSGRTLAVRFVHKKGDSVLHRTDELLYIVLPPVVMRFIAHVIVKMWLQDLQHASKPS